MVSRHEILLSMLAERETGLPGFPQAKEGRGQYHKSGLSTTSNLSRESLAG
jgi:hypothetical protein